MCKNINVVSFINNRLSLAYSYLLLIPSLNANLIFYFFNAKIFYPLFNPFTQHYYT